MKQIFKIDLNPNRIYGLDMLRAWAIIFVIIGHGTNLVPNKLKFISDFIIFDGVSIFFVLSGFLIGEILIKILETNYKRNTINRSLLFDFWIRRLFKTLPNYFLILGILVLLESLFSDDFVISSISPYLILFQNFNSPHPIWFFPEAWTLSIEVWFYLLCPLIIFFFMLFFKRSPRKSILITIILTIISITIFRYFKYESNIVNDLNDWDLLFRKQVMTRLDSVMYGFLGAYIKFYHPDKWLKNKKLFFTLGITIFLSTKLFLPAFDEINRLYICVFDFSLMSFATLLLLPYLNDLKTGSGRLYETITYISLISYSMYILNLSIIQQWIIFQIDWHYFFDSSYVIVVIRYGFYWILVLVLSAIMYKYYELPMMKLRENKKIKKWLDRLISK